jgi:multiple sugar transport system permease protein
MTTIAARLRIGPGETATSRERLAYRLLLPVFGTVVVIATIPFVLAVIESLMRGGEFVGLANYARALSNPLLVDSIRQTAIYGLIVVPSEILLGLALALLVHRTIRSASVKAAIYVLAIIPIVMPGVAAGVIFRLIYAPEYGLLNFILQQIGVIQQQILWLSVPPLAMLSVASVDIWQWTAFVYLVLFAGLQTVPQEAVEAAQVDGASSWAQFRHIELPFIRPLVLLVLFFRIADVLRVFDHVFILTGGGPGTTTEFLSLYLYRIAFKFSDLPQASALAVMMMLGMTLFYSVILRFMPLETD